MKSLVLFVAASLMLVGATVAVAFPHQVEAAWCQQLFPGDCFKSKADCRDSIIGTANTCVKAPKK